MKNPLVIKCEKIIIRRLINGKYKKYTTGMYVEDTKRLVRKFLQKYEKDSALTDLLWVLMSHFVHSLQDRKGLHKMMREKSLTQHQNETHDCANGGNSKGNIKRAMKV